MIWIVFSLLTLATILSVLWPLVRGLTMTTQQQVAVGFYKSQVAAIERDAANGLTSHADAAMAITEAARRLLSAGENKGKPAGSTSKQSVRLASAFAILIIPALAIGLYGRIGQPDLPDAPLQARLATPPENMDVPSLIAKLEAEVAARPGDARGFELLAPIYMRLNRYDDAARTYLRAIALQGDSGRLRADYAETFVAAAKGTVSPQAKAEFEAALKLDPLVPKARFYLGLAAEQTGDKVGAIAIFSKLVEEAAPGAGYVPSVNARLARLGGTEPPVSPAATIAALPDQERQGAIRGMVEGLAVRLAQNGKDEAGWLRLIRAFKVLNEEGRARVAMAEARKSLASDADALLRIGNLAREIGLEAQ